MHHWGSTTDFTGKSFFPLVTCSAIQIFKTVILYLSCPENDTSQLTSHFNSVNKAVNIPC